MRSRSAAVAEHIGVVATGVLQRVSENGQAIKGTFLVNGLGYPGNCTVIPIEPNRVDGDRAEWIAENIAEEVDMVLSMQCGLRQASHSSSVMTAPQ